MGRSEPIRLLLMGAAVVLCASAFLRWNAARTAEPEVLGEGGPALVVVTQEGDCPDTVEDLRAVLAAAEDRGLSTRVVRIPSTELGTALAGGAAGLRDLRRGRRLHRAVLRSGLRSTPALLVVDERGALRLGVALRPDGSAPEGVEAARVLVSLVHLLDGEGAAGPLRPVPGLDPGFGASGGAP